MLFNKYLKNKNKNLNLLFKFSFFLLLIVLNNKIQAKDFNIKNFNAINKKEGNNKQDEKKEKEKEQEKEKKKEEENNNDNNEKKEQEKNDDEKEKKNNEKKKDDDDDYEEPQPDPENDDIDQKAKSNAYSNENKKAVENKEKILDQKDKKINLTKAKNYLLFDEKIKEEKLKQIKLNLEKELIKNSSNKEILYFFAIVNARLAIINLGIGDDGIAFSKLAIINFKKIIKLSSNNIELIKICKANIDELYKLYIDRGLKYFKKGYNNRAKQNFENAGYMKPNSLATYLYLSSIFLMQEKYEDALDELSIYHKLGGQDAAYYYAMAIILDKQAKYENAIDIINQGLKIHSFNDGLIQRRFKILKKLDLLNDYDKRIKKANLNKGAKYYQLATFYKFVGKQEKVKSFFQKAARFSPNQFETQFAIGVYYYNKAAELSDKIFDESFLGIKKDEKKIIENKTKIKKKRKKKKISPETQIKRYLGYAKKRFTLANKLKYNQKIIIDKIKYIEQYLGKEKKNIKKKK